MSAASAHTEKRRNTELVSIPDLIPGDRHSAPAGALEERSA